ncbi:hypothetical protein QBC34DRAFT_76136 [Podospora aff. communis PSN243]|uniref:Uncharacterized protein n=1 Tax=Podospora aff. communis PSN243 TaxID=3040156 RepID=A0AAV9GQK0_9PEZI|nr:hypothetical protein QBC34DRAFT_76136 [Podospora aff. communis PSN243]
MDLFRRASFINHPQQHAGDCRGNWNGMQCWEIKQATDEEPWKTILDNAIQDVSKTRAIPRAAHIMFDLFLIGTVLETSTPYLMVSILGAHKKHSKSVVQRLSRANWTKDYPGLKIDHWDWPPDVPNFSLTAGVELSQEPGATNAHIPGLSMRMVDHGNGQRVQTVTVAGEDGRLPRCGIVSCTVTLPDGIYLAVPFHVFAAVETDEPDDGNTNADDVSSPSFSQSSNGDAGRGTSPANSTTSTSTSDGRHASPPSRTGQCAKPDDTGVSSALLSHPQLRKYLRVVSADLDYALLAGIVNAEESPEWVLCRSRVAPMPTGKTTVDTVTNSTGRLTGTLMGRACLMRLPRSQKFARFYPVAFAENSVKEGDCGSVVFDPSRGTIWGFIVAASTEAGIAYITSATHVLDDIVSRTGMSPIDPPALTSALTHTAAGPPEDARIKAQLPSGSDSMTPSKGPLDLSLTNELGKGGSHAVHSSRFLDSPLSISTTNRESGEWSELGSPLLSRRTSSIFSVSSTWSGYNPVASPNPDGLNFSANRPSLEGETILPGVTPLPPMIPAPQTASPSGGVLSRPTPYGKTKGHVASACVPCKRAHLR